MPSQEAQLKQTLMSSPLHQRRRSEILIEIEHNKIESNIEFSLLLRNQLLKLCKFSAYPY